MNKTPESLFDDIAQNTEVLSVFKHHSLRVMHLSTMLAKKVNCYDEDLRVASLLHDIGKVGLSSEILFKDGKLNELERTIIQSHSHIGNTIVRNVLYQNRAASFIRDHHENWDGTGYPRRLIGEDISIQGRIIRICDSFDTMTYDLRNYQKSKMSHEEALQELKDCAWKQYDGSLVNTFVELIEEIQLPPKWYDHYDLSILKNIFTISNE